MIIDAIWALLVLVASAIGGLVDALSVGWAPVDWQALGNQIQSLGSSPMWALVRWINYYLPLSEALLLAGVFFGVYVGVVVYRATVEVLQWIRVLGASSAR